MTGDSTDLAIFVIVVGLRVIIPLFIPRFPLPAILLAMIVDAADQTVFESLTDLDLTNYQSYDKALDVYYLAIAYLSTMRNWRNQIAFEAGRFLWYFRLVGVVIFELTQARAVLLIFPNTFEYFFDFFEGVRTRWNPERMSKRLVLGAAAFIWIAIKLPQEYWIHVAKLDTTDLIKEDLFGVPVDTGFGTIIADNPLFFVGLACFVAALILGLRYVILEKLPPKDWGFTLDADSQEPDVAQETIELQFQTMRGRILSIELLEKAVLLSLVMIIFTRIIPGTPSTALEQAIAVTLFLIISISISEWTVRIMGWSNQAIVGSFMGTMIVNSAIVFTLRWLVPGDREFNRAAALFFVFLVSLLIALYDRYRPIYLARFGDDRLERRLSQMHWNQHRST